MLFNSYIFIGLLIITFVFYYFPFFKKSQVQILILSSLIFYGYGQPYLLILLLLSAWINIISSYAVVNWSPSYRLSYAAFGVIINIGVLIFFKYSSLLATTFLNTDQGFGHMLTMIPLPIGISFTHLKG